MCSSVDEPRDDWRGLFFSRFLPLVQDAGSLSEAALVLNRDIWSIWGIVFQANQTPDIMSPFQVKNSCCLLSARPKERQTRYLQPIVSACRSSRRGMHPALD